MRYFGTRHDTSAITAKQYDAQAKVFYSVLKRIASLQEKVTRGNEFIQKSYERMQLRCAALVAVPGVAFIASVAVAQYGATDNVASITNVLTPGFFNVALPAVAALQIAGFVKGGVNYFRKGTMERSVALAEKQIKHALHDVELASQQTGIPVDTWSLRRLIDQHTRNNVSIDPSKVTERIVHDDQLNNMGEPPPSRRKTSSFSAEMS